MGWGFRMKPSISLILPTRKRCDKAIRFVESARRAATLPAEFEVVLGIDSDDHESQALHFEDVRYTTVIAPRRSMGAINTECAQKSNGDIIMLVNDDSVVRTEGWDESLRALHAQFADGVYLGYVNDLFKGQKLCTFPVISRTAFELLNPAFPESYQGAFIDYHLLDVFKRLQAVGHDRLVYLNDVVFEHLHFRSGKSGMDDTYRDRKRFGDDATFFELSNLRDDQACRLLQCINPAFEIPSTKRNAKLLWPRSLKSMVQAFAGRFLRDSNLPLRWRVFLFRWFLFRWLYARYFAQEGS